MPRRPRYDRYDDERPPARKRGNTALVVVLTVLGVVVGMFLVCCGGCYFLARSAKPTSADAVEHVIPAGESVTYGDLVVSVGSVAIDHGNGTSPGGRPHMSSSLMTVVVLKTVNKNAAKVGRVKGATRSAILRDELGNKYPQQNIIAESGFRCTTDGQLDGWGEYQIYPDKPVTDTLLFARPVPAATVLYLIVDADCYGASGTITFELPARLWKKH